MLKRLFRLAFLAILSITVLSLTILYPSTNSYTLASEDNGDNPLQIVIEKSNNPSPEENEQIAKENFNDYPDLGDEQVFPFVAGFGKNSGKD